MYRACSTWQYEVVGYLLENHLSGCRLGYLTGEAYSAIRAPRSHILDTGSHRNWRVLKSHDGHAAFAHSLKTGAAFAVYSYRDIRDVVFSLMHKRETTFDELIRQGMVHQLLANDRFWRAQPRVLIQRYEVMVADPPTAVLQLARHLGLGVTRRDAVRIADEYSLQSNQLRIDALRRRLEQAGVDLSERGNSQICDPITLLHWNHLRPCPHTTWRTEASPRHRRLLDRLCGPWLRVNGYDPTEDIIAGLSERSSPSHSGQGLRNRDELNLALGRASSSLKAAAVHCPRTARWIKALLRLASGDPHTISLARADLVSSTAGENANEGRRPDLARCSSIRPRMDSVISHSPVSGLRT
jgi:hypothetical protein